MASCTSLGTATMGQRTPFTSFTDSRALMSTEHRLRTNISLDVLRGNVLHAITEPIFFSRSTFQ